MKNSLFVLLLPALLCSCQDPLDKKINLETMGDDITEIKKEYEGQYAEDDYATMAAVYALSSAFNDPIDKSYRAALDDAKADRIRKEEEARIEAKRIAALEKRRRHIEDSVMFAYNNIRSSFLNLIDVEVVNKTSDEGMFSFYYVDLKFKIINKSSRSILAFRGAMEIKDLFGEGMGKYEVRYDKNIKPHSTIFNTTTYSINQFISSESRVYSIPFSSMTFEFIPDKIILSDGETIVMPDLNEMMNSALADMGPLGSF